MTKIKKFKAPIIFWALMVGIMAFALNGSPQNPPVANVTPVQATQGLYYTTPISATAAVNVATTLTLPAPASGLYNYVCKLAFNLSNDTTGTVVTNAASTSTNFGTFTFKVSHVVTASAGYDSPTYDFGSPATGCAKSVSPGTATTFVSTAGLTHSAWTWYALYYQAP